MLPLDVESVERWKRKRGSPLAEVADVIVAALRGAAPAGLTERVRALVGASRLHDVWAPNEVAFS